MLPYLTPDFSIIIGLKFLFTLPSFFSSLFFTQSPIVPFLDFLHKIIYDWKVMREKDKLAYALIW